MGTVDQCILDLVAGVRRHTKRGVVAPNKPITLLWALDRVNRGKPRLTPFSVAEKQLRPLLDAYGTPGTAASYAFWRLQNDGDLWEVTSPLHLPARSGDKEPKISMLRVYAHGGFKQWAYERLAGNADLRTKVAATLVDATT